MTTTQAGFTIGQVVQHVLFGYRGVIVDVDPIFQGTDEWYNKMTVDQPSKEKPWYHLLVHGSIHHAYAAETQLIPDSSGEAIEHPELDYFFNDFQNGMYIPYRSSN